MTQWLGELIGQGIEAAHVFCGTDDAEMTYSNRVEPSASIHVEDAKGARTVEYRIKRALLLAVHGIKILET